MHTRIITNMYTPGQFNLSTFAGSRPVKVEGTIKLFHSEFFFRVFFFSPRYHGFRSYRRRDTRDSYVCRRSASAGRQGRGMIS